LAQLAQKVSKQSDFSLCQKGRFQPTIAEAQGQSKKSWKIIRMGDVQRRQRLSILP
jgi:hypothetical protein